MKYLVLFLFIINFSITADEKVGGQEIIERLDRALALNDGLTYATLSIKKGNHETHFWKVSIFKFGDDVLYTFEVTHRKPLVKFLSIKKGHKLIYHNVLSGKFFQIEQLERIENVLHTSFSYLDFSNYSYESNYKSLDVTRVKSETGELSVVKLVPIFSPAYKHLQLYVNNSSYLPKKMDFTSQDGLLIKTLKFQYGKLKVREENSISEIDSLVRLEMNDNATNYTSTLEFKSLDKNVKPDKIFFEMKTMYEK